MKKNTYFIYLFLIVSGIVGIISLAIFNLSLKNSQSQKGNKPHNPPTEDPQNPPLPEKDKPLPPEENGTCPYLKEKNLTIASSESQKNLKWILREEEKELSEWRKIPHSFIVILS